MSIDSLLEAAKQLSPDDRIRLVEQMWNSVAENDSPVELSLEQKAELDRRLDRLDRERPSGQSWDSLKSELLRNHES
jgi:putative addiction module component (TIGR02574 family)